MKMRKNLTPTENENGWGGTIAFQKVTKIHMLSMAYGSPQSVVFRLNFLTFEINCGSEYSMMICHLTKKAEPPPTRDVNRDSGTDSANGGWLRRLVRHQRFKLNDTPFCSETIWWSSKRTILDCSFVPTGSVCATKRTPPLICHVPAYGLGWLGACDGTVNVPSEANVIVLSTPGGADACCQVPRICLLNVAALDLCRLQAVSSRPAAIIMCVYFIVVFDDA